MIKLTPEQKYELATKFFSTSWNTRVAVGLVDVVEAEVLRLNGITEQKLIRTNYCCPDAVGTGKVVCTNCAMTQEDYQDGRPRATGCPEAMDDTGHLQRWICLHF